MTGNDALEGGISIIEGAIRIRFTNGELKTLHSNDISLDEPETPLYDMVNQPIESIYRPREEKTENLQYKEEKKKSDENSQTGGLFEKSTEEIEDSEDTIESGSNDATENSD